MADNSLTDESMKAQMLGWLNILGIFIPQLVLLLIEGTVNCG